MSEKELYNQVKAMHPDWTDEQIWTQVSVMIGAEKPITEKGPSVSPNDEDFVRLILERAKIWLMENLPAIFERVASFFAELLRSLPSWFKEGVNYVIRKIASYFK